MIEKGHLQKRKNNYLFKTLLFLVLLFTVKTLASNSLQAASYDEIRLPSFIQAENYKLDFTTDLESFKFHGQVQISLDISKDTDFVVVHKMDMNVEFIKMAQGANVYSYSRMEDKLDKEYVIIHFKNTMPKGKYELTLKYNASLNNNMRGYYLSTYTKKNKIQHLATTQFEPTDARFAFPCLDEPSQKATFEIKMTVADKYHAISNMPVKSTFKSVGTNIYTFEKTVKMSTYLVAFVVSDFESISANTKNGVKVSVYTQVGDSHLGEYALEVAVPILEYYQKTYGIDFPLPKLDMIAIPDFSAGAMENWGLVTYRDTALLYDEKISTAANKERVATVVGHELAHQWFGNLVTMKWWNDLWLNEGFAAFMEYKSVDSVEGKWEMMDNFIPNSLVKALSADESRYTHSIAADVKNPSEISELFDDITYGKGSSVLRMLEAWMNEKYGDKMFFEKIHGYLSKHAYGNAETKDLWDALRTEDQNVGEIMKTWTDQAGFPFLQFNAPKQNSVVVKQERFLFSHLLAGDYPVMEEQVWSIPLSYAIYSNSTGRPKVFDRGFTQIEKLGDVKVDFKKAYPKDSILLANFAQTGVYRSLYDERTYLYLVDWLRDDLEILPAVERSGLISDVLSMTFSGRLQNPIISMEFLKLLGDDDSIFVWESMMRDLTKLKGIFALTGTYGSMVNFQTSILEKVINSVGWVETHTIGNLQGRALLRAKILSEAVSNNHKPTVAKALGFFQLIKQGRKNEVLVSADVMGAIYDAGVIYGDLNDYKYVLSSFQNSTFAPDQQMYLHALASSSVPYLQTKTLNWAISGDVRKQDIQGVLHRVSVSTPVGHLTTWIFMMENWERITKMFDKAGGFGKFNKLLEDVCGSFTQQYLINEAERLFIKQTEEGFYIPNGAELAVKKGLETAKQFLAF